MRFGRFLRIDIIVFGQRTLPSPANRLRRVETVFGGEKKDPFRTPNSEETRDLPGWNEQ